MARLGLVAAAMLVAGSAQAQNLRVGMFEDLDIMDPALSRFFSGLQILSATCDKLLDLSPDLTVVPALAESYEWVDGARGLVLKLRRGVTFQDGAPFDAEAVRANIDRQMNLQGSFRRGEMPDVTGVTIIDSHTARIELRNPFIPLMSILVTRGGMMISPRAMDQGRDFARNPVCSGPYRFTERVAQDRTVVDRWPGHWNAQNIHIQRITFRPMADGTVRLANLRGGALDIMERVGATDIEQVRRTPGLALASAPELGHNFLRFNIANGPGAASPFARDARLREALELSIDRAALNQVVFEGAHIPGNQWVNPQSPFYARNVPIPARDVAKARRLLAEAGHPAPTLRLVVPNAGETIQVAEVIQAMARDAGIDIRIQAMEIGAAVRAQINGDFEVFLGFWGGRSDPDGNISFHIGTGGPNNDGKYSNAAVDGWLAEARAVPETAARSAIYERVAAQVLADRPYVYLWHRRNSWAYTDRLTGFVAYPDGVFRWAGMRLRER
ncbi:ABC transporter substrate-binding protein [Falsiroseomonas ponticola]|uniref:ABC transporter substrate-binding protein n=1 Tax=Falsiroseomonas ponticola TaxID=2786951 RepID=UPI001932F3B8|nr:ABC transporter substrate-binding protein [Roseomonas ponticola]